MIVVDASILVGLLKDEADVMMLEPLVIGPARCIIGAPTLVEASLWALTNGRQRSIISKLGLIVPCHGPSL